MESYSLLIGTLSIVVIVLGGLLYMNRTAQRVRVREQVLRLPDWPQGFDGVTCLWITDLHRYVLSADIKKKLRDTQIDLVFLGGDITEKGVPMSQVGHNIEFLASLAPTYFVWGNHDYKVNYRELDLLLRNHGVHILDNRATSFESGSDRLWILGVDDVSAGRDQLHFALQDVTQEGYRLLLAHDPIIIRKITKDNGIQMVWSGHTHGGQIRLPFLSSWIVGPFYQRYLAGFYSIEDKGLKLFISKGVGTSHFPLRFGAEPEMHLFTLKRGS